jgi:hypothetical protein
MQDVLADESLTNNEKSSVISSLTTYYDDSKVQSNAGTKRVCEGCKQECLATSFCELCIRNYLKANFSNWTSGNNKIDNLIQECQMRTLAPYKITEWIPYQNLQNIKYLTEGGCSEIYIADWVDGCYNEWDSNKQQLIRYGTLKVALKRLENVGRANRSWFEEVYNLKLIISFCLKKIISMSCFILFTGSISFNIKQQVDKFCSKSWPYSGSIKKELFHYNVFT